VYQGNQSEVVYLRQTQPTLADKQESPMGQAREKQQLSISQRARERRNELQDYSTDALIDLILYMEGLLPSDTATFPRPLGLRPFEMAWQPHEYVRVGRPPVSEKVWHETAWRIACQL
jgi:hypothetical protein